MPQKHRLPIAKICTGALLTLVASCGSEQDAAQQNEAADKVTRVELPPFPIVEPPLDREALLLATIRAASAHAGGKDDAGEQRALDGKRFELRIRFGCQEVEGEPLAWRFDDAKRTVRLRAAPTISSQDPVVRTIGAAGFETVEGFWIPRPWLLAASCPATRPSPPDEQQVETQSQKQDQKQKQTAKADGAESEPPPEPPSARPRVGIAQFFTREDPRTQRRRQRPYEANELLDEGETPSDRGYDLVLSGRLRQLADRRVIACTSQHPAAPPQCIISAQFGRVRIERPATKEIVAQWGEG